VARIFNEARTLRAPLAPWVSQSTVSRNVNEQANPSDLEPTRARARCIDALTYQPKCGWPRARAGPQPRTRVRRTDGGSRPPAPGLDGVPDGGALPFQSKTHRQVGALEHDHSRVLLVTALTKGSSGLCPPPRGAFPLWRRRSS